MKIYNFDLLTYPHAPKEAPRTPVPSNYFDLLKGAANYKEHLDEMAYCEDLGFDGVVFNEHHYSAYGTMPSPNLIAGNPDTVARQIQAQRQQIGADHFMGMFHIGNLAHDKVINSLNLSKKEMMPRFP